MTVKTPNMPKNIKKQTKKCFSILRFFNDWMNKRWS